MQLVLVFAPSTVAMLAAVGFRLFRAEVERTEQSIIRYQYFWFIHIVTIASPSYAQGYAVGRNNDAILRGAVGAEDDGARVVIYISRLRQWL